MAQNAPVPLGAASCARCISCQMLGTGLEKWQRHSPWPSPEAALHSGNGYTEEDAWFFVEEKWWSLWGSVCVAIGDSPLSLGSLAPSPSSPVPGPPRGERGVSTTTATQEAWSPSS